MKKISPNTKNSKNEQNINILNELIFSHLVAKMANRSISNNNQNETINYNDEKMLIFFLPDKYRIDNNISNIKYQTININSSTVTINNINNVKIIHSSEENLELKRKIKRINNEINNFKNKVENINIQNESFYNAFSSFLEAINDINNNGKNEQNENLNN